MSKDYCPCGMPAHHAGFCPADPRDIYEPECPTCGSAMEWEQCWQCGGEGGFHDCGEDTCCCLDGDEITVDCDICAGRVEYLACIALPHKDEPRFDEVKRERHE